LESLLVLEGGELFKKRFAVGKKAFVSRAQVVQPGFTFGCPENSVLRAPSVTKREDIAFHTITG
jgi:hypothetical protein